MKQWTHQKPDERYTVQIAYGGKPVAGIQSDRISEVEEEVMYWRKANHIHGWFVDNVQSGKDDCGTYHVEWERLERLLATCEEVLNASKLVQGTVLVSIVYTKKHPEGEPLREVGKVLLDTTMAKSLLPRRDGFFFGGPEYDEFYLGDVMETRDWAARMLADRKAGVPGEIYYHSSW